MDLEAREIREIEESRRDPSHEGRDDDGSGMVGAPMSERLLATAARLFRINGYMATTTREIARVVGIEKGTLYHHIRGKEDLLFDLCVSSLSPMCAAGERALTEQPGPRQQLQQVIRDHVSLMLTDRDKHATMLMELRGLSSERRRTVVALRDRYEDLVRTVVGRCQVAGVLRGDIPIKLLTLSLLNLLNWTIFWYLPEGEYSPKQIADALTRIYIEGAGVHPMKQKTTSATTRRPTN